MAIVGTLIDELEEYDTAAFVERQEENYGQFLTLYEAVGYAPVEVQARAEWRKRSTETWSKLNERLPGTYTGGGFEGRMSSAVGTLPMSPTIAYGHSFCMLKTLEAGATMFSQSLHTLTWVERLPSTEYWGGSYNQERTFVIRFQRPPDFVIPYQIELQALRCFPGEPAPSSNDLTVAVSETVEDDEQSLHNGHRVIYRHLKKSSSELSGLHSVKMLTIKCRRSGISLALILLQASIPELTAINIFAAPWVFPSRHADVSMDQLRIRLREIPELQFARLEILLPHEPVPFNLISTERIERFFWAFTPKKSIPELRQSFRSAFTHLLSRFSETELQNLRSLLLSATGKA